jgi:hypothetical protein
VEQPVFAPTPTDAEAEAELDYFLKEPSPPRLGRVAEPQARTQAAPGSEDLMDL